VYHPRSISLLFQYTILYINHALFISCYNTQHCTFPTLYFSLLQYTTLYITHGLFLSSFNTQHCLSTLLYFSPVSVHKFVYNPLNISPLFHYTKVYIPTPYSLLFQYTTLCITHDLFLFCFGKQHCISQPFSFSPGSVRNIVYHARYSSLLFQ